MLVKDIRQIAKQKGLNPKNKMKKSELVRAIQTEEGNFPCFETAADYCDQFACLWREDCLKQ